MIRLPERSSLSGLEQYGLDVLVDLSRVLPAVGAAAGLGVSLTTGADDGGTDPNVLGAAGAITCADGEVRVARGALRMVGEVVGAVREQRTAERDRHGRVPSGANLLVQTGLDRQAVVSRLAERLRRSVVEARGSRPFRAVAPWPAGRRWAVAFTHDLDAVDWWPLFTALRVAELAAKGRVGAAMASLGAAVSMVGRNPVWRAIQRLLEHEAREAVQSTWFVLCGQPSLRTMSQGDLTYRPDSGRSRRILGAVTEHGHEIALHGSFATLASPATFASQRARLADLTGQSVAGVRQHYLRMVPGATQRAMSAAAFAYDATYGFPDRNGFRLGVADVVPAWDDAAGTATKLEEIPLVWMDRAQSKYQGIEDPRIWVEDALELAEECRAVGGLWVGLWHPNLDPALGFPRAPQAYAALVRRLREWEPWVASTARIAAWRSARRTVRATGVTPDGSVVAAVAASSGGEREGGFRLEDVTGRPAEAVTGRL